MYEKIGERPTQPHVDVAPRNDVYGPPTLQEATNALALAAYPEHVRTPETDTGPDRTVIWATPEAGWGEKSYQDLSFGGKIKYGIESLGSKILALLNAVRQSLTPNGNASKEILKNKDLANTIDKEALLRGDSHGPSGTVIKLVDKEGPRSARLGTTNLEHLIKSISTNNVTVVDGYNITNAGIGFINVKARKPSEKLNNASPDKTTLMPFVFPRNKGSEEHVVLISVDPKTKEIRYFDPKGAHSDDPARVGGFKDDPLFNMRTDLETLKTKLGTGWTIKENTKAYQHDATNCGTYVALAMRDEADGKPVGEGWQSGLTWVNAQKTKLATGMWNHFRVLSDTRT